MIPGAPVSRRTPTSASTIELSAIKAMEIEASRLPDVVSLAQGIPSFDTPQPIKDYVAARIQEGVCARYSLSPGLPELRELISESLLEDGMRYDPDGEILVTCGAIEAVSATLLALVGEGDEVVVASPTYASYLPSIRLSGARPRFVALDEDRNFDLDSAAIERVISNRTRAVLLCNPNNPTGTVYSVAETEQLLRLSEQHGFFVITDDVYKDFLYTSEEPGNPAKNEAHRDRVLRICSFSKAYGMTGWRVGFVHGARRHIDRILAVHDTLVTCAPVVSQHAAIAALRFGAPFVNQFREEFRQRRDRVVERLDALDRYFDYQMPNASYFAFPRVKDTVPLARDSKALAHDILHRAGVALVPGVAFGPTGEAHLRFCYARPPRDIERAFDRLDDYFAGKARITHLLPPAPASAPSTPRWRQLGESTLRGLAQLRLRRQRPKVVAIAGGRGKTVLKRTLTELLRPHFRVRGNPLSHNTEIGLALSILDVRLPSTRPSELAGAFVRGVGHAIAPDAVDVLVLELGTRRRGDMRRLLAMVRPDIAIVTPLATGEVDDLDALQTLQSEVDELIAVMRSAGRPIVVCRDDGLVDSGVATHTYGDTDFADDGATLRIGDRGYAVARELVGQTARRAMVAGVVTAQLLGLPEEVLRAQLAAPVHARQVDDASVGPPSATDRTS